MKHTRRNCDHCGKVYNADMRNVKRGWGLCCSKSCAAKKREAAKPGYTPERVEANNIRRAAWWGVDENEYGVYRGRRSSEGYKLYQDGDMDTAVDEFGNAVYTIANWEHEHPFSEDSF